jgi:hypothetical protein
MKCCKAVPFLDWRAGEPSRLAPGGPEVAAGRASAAEQQRDGAAVTQATIATTYL